MELNKILVIYDPTREEQPALDRAAITAEEIGASVHLFACIHTGLPGEEDEAVEIERQLGELKTHLEQRVAPIVEKGVTVSIETEWHKDWPHAAIRAAERSQADIVFKSSFKHRSSERILKSTSDWILIRECMSPVLLVKENSIPEVSRILAGVDISARAESYEKLNEHIIEFSRRLIEAEHAEVHVVNAFPDFRVLPDKQKLIDLSGVDSDHIHIKLGAPDKVIVDTAKRINANLVVVGNSHRSGLAAMLHGNTAEKILDKLDCNVLAMP